MKEREKNIHKGKEKDSQAEESASMGISKHFL
jgi:hypothetical protein